jgi:hypothetical protein
VDLLVGCLLLRVADAERCPPLPSGEAGSSVNDYTERVRGYLVYCRRATMQLTARGSALDPKYHPTADGCVKLTPHSSVPAEARKIRETFRELQDDHPNHHRGDPNE